MNQESKERIKVATERSQEFVEKAQKLQKRLNEVIKFKEGAEAEKTNELEDILNTYPIKLDDLDKPAPEEDEDTDCFEAVYNTIATAALGPQDKNGDDEKDKKQVEKLMDEGTLFQNLETRATKLEEYCRELELRVLYHEGKDDFPLKLEKAPETLEDMKEHLKKWESKIDNIEDWHAVLMKTTARHLNSLPKEEVVSLEVVSHHEEKLDTLNTEVVNLLEETKRLDNLVHAHHVNSQASLHDINDVLKELELLQQKMPGVKGAGKGQGKNVVSREVLGNATLSATPSELQLTTNRLEEAEGKYNEVSRQVQNLKAMSGGTTADPERFVAMENRVRELEAQLDTMTQRVDTVQTLREGATMVEPVAAPAQVMVVSEEMQAQLREKDAKILELQEYSSGQSAELVAHKQRLESLRGEHATAISEIQRLNELQSSQPTGPVAIPPQPSQELETLRQQLEVLTSAKAQAEDSFSKLSGENQLLLQQLEAASSEKSAMDQLLRTKEVELLELQRRGEEGLGEHAALNASLQAQMQQMEMQLAQQMQQREMELSAATSDFDQNKKMLEQQNEALQLEMAALSRQMGSQNQELSSAKAQLEELERLKLSLDELKALRESEKQKKDEKIMELEQLLQQKVPASPGSLRVSLEPTPAAILSPKPGGSMNVSMPRQADAVETITMPIPSDVPLAVSPTLVSPTLVSPTLVSPSVVMSGTTPTVNSTNPAGLTPSGSIVESLPPPSVLRPITPSPVAAPTAGTGPGAFNFGPALKPPSVPTVSNVSGIPGISTAGPAIRAASTAGSIGVATQPAREIQPVREATATGYPIPTNIRKPTVIQSVAPAATTRPFSSLAPSAVPANTASSVRIAPGAAANFRPMTASPAVSLNPPPMQPTAIAQGSSMVGRALSPMPAAAQGT